MTVSVTTAQSGPYTPNGVTTAFPFTFAVGSASELSVMLDGAEVSSGLYTVTLNDPDAAIHEGGTITFAAAPTGTALTIWSAPDFSQEIAFTDAGPFLASTTDEANDRAAIKTIYLKSSLLPPETPAGRALKVLGWDDKGRPIATLPVDSTVFAGSGTGLATVKWYGAVGDGATDDTAAFTAAFANASKVHIPAGTYIVTALSIPANTEITTEGFDTLIKQKSGTAAGTRIISVAGSNVRIGDIALEGRLGVAGDTTGEQNHGIFIYANGASLSNISLGNVNGTNIRGDVVLIGQAVGFTVSQVTVGNVLGANVYRNGVSVVGGSAIDIESITGSQIGYLHFDIEPDIGIGTVQGVNVGYIKGRNVGLVGPTAADFVGGVRIGYLDLDPAFSAASSPAYSVSTTYGLQVRNLKHAHIEKAKANGFNGPGVKTIWNGGELAKQTASFGELELTSCSLTDATNYGYFTGTPGVTLARIETLKATVVDPKAAILNCDFAVIQSAEISNASTAGAFRSCGNLFVANLNHSGAGSVFLSCDGLVAINGVVAATAATLGSFCTGMVIVGYTVTATTLFNTCTRAHARDSTLNAVFYNEYVGNLYTIDGAGALNTPGTVFAAGFGVGANAVVGARNTGWTADTGTAKKTATATYTVGSTLTYSAGYVQAEHTATSTRLQLIEPALRDASQEIKALKDALITHGLIGT